MENSLLKFRKYFNQRYDIAREWKKQSNSKVIGCLPMYFPEEIIHAAGVLPVTLFGSEEEITIGNKHLMVNTCGMVRSTFDSLLKDKYEFVDGIVALLVCDQVRFFFEVWNLDHPLPFFHQISRPYKMDETVKPFLISEIKRFKKALEEFIGINISQETLLKSIDIYNETRALMRELYDIRKEKPGYISAEDCMKIITVSMFMPKERYNLLLKNLLSEAHSEESAHNKKLKIIISGHPCDIPPKNLLTMIEELDVAIVDDDLFNGGRYFAADVNVDGEPLIALADHLLNPIPCTTYHYPENWEGSGEPASNYGDYIVNMAKNSDATGVILLRETYCDPYDLEFIMMKHSLEDADLPYLSVFTEHETRSIEPLRTRIHAFIESLDN